MKKLSRTLTLGALLAAIAPAAMSTDKAPTRPRNPMAQMLGLTPEQEQKIESIRRQYQQKIEKLAKEGEAKIEAVLTPEQKKKLEQIKAQRAAMMQRMREMMAQRARQAQQQGAAKQ